MNAKSVLAIIFLLTFVAAATYQLPATDVNGILNLKGNIITGGYLVVAWLDKTP